MDLWVVAAATGAGYLAKYWHNLSGEKDGSSESSYGSSVHMQYYESQTLLGQIRDLASPFGRLARKPFGRDLHFGREGDDSHSKFQEMDWSAGDYENYNAVGMSEKNEVSDYSGDDLLKHETNRLKRSRPSINRRSRRFPVKPLNPSESSITAQLYKEQHRKEEYAFSSLPLLSSPIVRPFLVTDMSSAEVDNKVYRLKKNGGITLEEESIDTLRRTYSSEQIPSDELHRKAERPYEKLGFDSHSTKLSSEPFPSQGFAYEMVLFFIGITIGTMSAVAANKREVDSLNELLKHAENLVRDLHEEIEMKDMLTVKELAGEDNDYQGTIDCSPCNQEPNVSCSKQDEIEAELEAELERLELNVKSSTLERISDFVELDPDFEANVAQGDLRVDEKQPQSESDSNVSRTFRDHVHSADYAVSPRALTLCLHNVIESRLEARIQELEAALHDSQKRVHFLEWQKIASLEGLAQGEVGSSSTPGSLTSANEVNGYNHVEKNRSPDKRLFEGLNNDGYGCTSQCDFNERRLSSGLVHNKILAWEECISGSQGSNEAFESEDEALIAQIMEKARQYSFTSNS
ncbi:hypothetical protein NMG60_11036173 [Bertholletia excelsa]